MGKQKQSSLTQEAVDMVINRLAALNSAQIAEELRRLTPTLLADGMGGATRAAESFTFTEVVDMFGLNYIVTPDNMEPHIWSIEDSKLEFKMTPCFCKLPVPPLNSAID
jgi:hypothetical protein